MTPELPRAPMSDPWLIALHTPAMSSAPSELGHHRLQGEGHVGAGVAVGHRVDVEPVEALLVGPQGVAVADHAGAQVLGSPASPSARIVVAPRSTTLDPHGSGL